MKSSNDSILRGTHEIHGKVWTPGDAPWEYTTSSYWYDKIFDAVEVDEEFLEESKTLGKE
ncbi:hypothetical protein ACFWMS_23090 [Peribacillus butanolivorans]|uniref:hypothetical protein n=1 Tax=Peribacillus butanolivorans TaxID=421767 RepID=UPI0036555844